ncbi:hypothetical protein FACS1894217_06720 [Clostridia bacterium]|nr:hypothetical protein FACS1894217_06720 [Clostridia bacterium]
MSEKKGRRAVPIAVSVATSLLLSLVVLFVFAQAISASAIPESTMGWGAVIAVLVGAFVCGVRGVKMFGGLLSGIIAGFAYFLLLLLVGAMIFMRVKPEVPVLNLVVAAVVGGGLAGLLGGLRKNTNRKKR